MALLGFLHECLMRVGVEIPWLPCPSVGSRAMCFHRFPEHLCKIKIQLPTVIPGLRAWPLLTFFPSVSCFPSPQLTLSPLSPPPPRSKCVLESLLQGSNLLLGNPDKALGLLFLSSHLVLICFKALKFPWVMQIQLFVPGLWKVGNEKN